MRQEFESHQLLWVVGQGLSLWLSDDTLERGMGQRPEQTLGRSEAFLPSRPFLFFGFEPSFHTPHPSEDGEGASRVLVSCLNTGLRAPQALRFWLCDP